MSSGEKNRIAEATRPRGWRSGVCGGVFMATCIASAMACVLMGLMANYPIALAPGMGENFFFAFTLAPAR